MALEITDENYESLLGNNDNRVVIDFWAERCGPCIKVGESIELLAEEYNGKAIIGKVDVDANPKLSFKYRIRNIPTIIYLKDGEMVDKQIGTASKTVLEDKLKAIL